MILTNELIERCKTAHGGYTRRTLQCFGVEWPPIKGWKNGIIGSEISAELYTRAFLSMKRPREGRMLAQWEKSVPYRVKTKKRKR